MALEGHRGLELVRRVVGREALEDGLVEAARRLRAVRLKALLISALVSCITVGKASRCRGHDRGGRSNRHAASQAQSPAKHYE